MSGSPLTGLPVLPSDPLKLNNVSLGDVYRQLGINYADRLFARIMDGDKENIPLENITWRKLLTDATKVATALKQALDSTSSGGEKFTFAMLAKSSYAYYVNFVAGWLNDWTVLLLSVKNSIAGNDSLLRAVKASALITDAKNRTTAEALVQELPIQLIDLFYPEDIDSEVELPQGPIDVHPASSADLKSIALYLHSSGTSGHPKPIPLSHEFLTRDILVTKGNTTYIGAPVYSPLPLFHAAGVYCFVRWPIGAAQIPTFIDTELPPTGASFLRHLKRLPGALCFVVPVLLEDALREPREDQEVLKTTRMVFYGGAPLDKAAGKQLLEMGVPLAQLYATTEVSVVTVLDFPGPPESRIADASYVRFWDEQCGIHWEPFDGKLSELIVCPGKIYTPAVFNHQNPLGYATNDLWEPHPTIPGLYRHCGRKDSVTVLSNGEKTANRQIENLLMDDPLINGVVVFGTGRPLNGVVVRQSPSTSPFSSSADFIDAIWPTIEHLNTIVPNHSRIIRQMVVVADVKTKPFVESDKGSIRLKDTLDLYKAEIDAAYDALEAENGEEAVKEVETLEQIEKYVAEVVCKIAKRPVGHDDDFFESGLDSLHAIQIRSAIKPLFTKFVKGEELAYNIAYDNPTISRLSVYLIARSKGQVVNSNDSNTVVSRIGSCVERWTANLPERQASVSRKPERKTFALTGGTGSLGVYTLRYLLERDDVEKVYCLHRGASDVGAERQRKLFQDRGLPVQLLNSDKVAFIQTDFSKPDLGLSTDKYDELRGSLTHIVHSAWELNFNWSLERFEKAHVAGVRHLIDLSIASTLPTSPRVVFISSISAVPRGDPSTPVPEQPFTDPGSIDTNGYGEAKFVSERVLDIAARRSGVPVSIIRSGQIAGSSGDGYWAPTEYIPTIFKSSKILGKVPNKFPDTRWLPADYCGRAVVDLSLQNDEALQYYHLENPNTTSWSTIASLFTQLMPTKIEQVNTKDWLAAVEQANRDGVEIPAAALLQFYSDFALSESMVQLGTSKAAKISKAIEYGPVESELMKKYISWI